MKKLRILFFVLVFVAAFGIAIFQINMSNPKINGSVSNFLPEAEYLSSEKDNNLEIWNYQYKDIPFNITSETTIITEFDGQFESTHIETNYLHNLFQYHGDKIKELADNYGIGLYDNSEEFSNALLDMVEPMIYYDLRSDTCYLYCFINNSSMKDIHTLFDFFGSVMVLFEGYLPEQSVHDCKSEILFCFFDKNGIDERNFFNSTEFYSEFVSLTKELYLEPYRGQICNTYFNYIEKSVFQSNGIK